MILLPTSTSGYLAAISLISAARFSLGKIRILFTDLIVKAENTSPSKSFLVSRSMTIRTVTCSSIDTMMETGLFATTVALLVVLLSVLVNAGSDASTAGLVRQKVVIGVDGGTKSIRACCFDATNGHVLGEACAVPYETSHPRPGWAEQNPYDWYENCGTAVRGAVASIPSDDGPCEIVAICIDTTCCSVVALDKDGRPLMPCILWMDQRAAPQTNQILQLCKGDPALDVNCGGQGPISAEWMPPKALWIAQNEPEV